jgi:DNA-binding response OmpR family regulator
MVVTMDAKVNAPGHNNGVRNIVVVEDAREIANSIQSSLEHQGFRVLVAETGQAALDLVFDHPPDLLLLDIDLPGRIGFELCRRFREDAATTHVPILMLTAPAGESDELLGVELGVDDYLSKPFQTRELLARVNAILRRTDRPELETPIYDDGILFIDPWTFSVRYEGREVRLTRKEMRLLEELARNEGRVMMREVLIDRIWGLRSRRHYGDSRTLDVHIRRLRAKLGNPKLIETITSIGYRLVGARSKSE